MFRIFRGLARICRECNGIELDLGLGLFALALLAANRVRGNLARIARLGRLNSEFQVLFCYPRIACPPFPFLRVL